LKNDVNAPSKINKQKNVKKIALRSRIQIYQSEVWIRVSGSVPRCHRSATLLTGVKDQGDGLIIGKRRPYYLYWLNPVSSSLYSEDTNMTCLTLFVIFESAEEI
jgi:hypothetical protein